MNVEKYVEKVSDLFVLSDSFLRIKELIDDDASTIDDISDVILLDPALASTILKLSNSSFFNYPGKIDTISKAVLVLGITEVYNLVITYFTTEALKNVGADAEYLDDFWLKSVDCALLIKFLGTNLRVANAERLFILGLLHNLGELIVQHVSPELVTQCESDDSLVLPWRKQQQVLGFTFGECSAELFKHWQLPYSLFAPIRNQDVDDPSQYNIETQLLFVAKRIVNKNLLLTNNKFQQLVHGDLMSGDVLSILQLDEQTLSSAVDYCDLERMGLLSILNPRAAMVY